MSNPQVQSLSNLDGQGREPVLALALEALAARLVGRSLLLATQDCIRKAMLREALERTEGNYTKAAKLLGVQRQAVQQMVSRFELHHWVRSVRRDSSAVQHNLLTGSLSVHD